MKKLFIYTLLSLLSGFVMGQDNKGKPLTSVIKETCSNTYIEVYPQSSIIKKTNRLLFFGAEVCDSSTNEDVVSFCNNQFAYYEDGLILYTQEFSNEWYINGKPKHVLLMVSANLFVYTHYDLNGEQTGEEFFKHDSEKKDFFIPSGKWWKRINGEQIYLDYPLYFDKIYFDY